MTGVRQQDAYNLIVSGYGRILSLSLVYKLYSKFRRGRELVTDEPRSGRPRVAHVDPEFLRSIIAQHPQMSIRELTRIFGVGRTTIHRRLREMGYLKRRSVRYRFQPLRDNREQRVEICVSLLLKSLAGSFLDRIITCDERWLIYESSPAKYWSPQSKRVVLPKSSRPSPLRIQVSVWWCSGGLLLCHFFEPEETLTSIKHAALFNDALLAIGEYPGGPSPLLLQDSHPPHVSVYSRMRNRERGVKQLPHPAHSPDLAPTDFWVFQQFNDYMASGNFGSSISAEIRDHFLRFLNTRPSTFYADGIAALPRRWEACISLEGRSVSL